MALKLQLNRLQRKVLLVVLVIVVVPMMVAGVLSAYWVSRSFEQSIERWVREAAQVSQAWIETQQRNQALFAEMLADTASRTSADALSTRGPVPRKLQPLAREFGIQLVQVYSADRTLLHSSLPVRLMTQWEHGQRQAVLKVERDGKSLLAVTTVAPWPPGDNPCCRLVLGSLLDRGFIDRMNQMSGLRNRLFYPEHGDYTKAFSDSDPPLTVRLPTQAFERLRARHDYYSNEAEDGRFRGLYTPLADASGRVEAVLFAGLQRLGSDEILTRPAELSLAIVLLGSLIGSLTGLGLSRFVVRPVEQLRDGVLQLAAQDFRASVPIDSRDELGDLARAFNAMAQGLREARDVERREFQKDKITAMGELSLALAHEIRNPVGVINTAAALLKKASPDPERCAELVGAIQEESRRIDQLLKDFQQLARHRRPEFAELDPAEPLERALRMALAAREDIRVEQDLRHGTARICADPDLLRQAWANLVGNAIEAIGAKPGTLRVTSEREQGDVVLAIEDSGPGIPVELMPRVFEPFFTTKEQGTGLGLTLANTLVEANGGRLELQPPEGRGARFAMRFPVCLASKKGATEG